MDMTINGKRLTEWEVKEVAQLMFNKYDKVHNYGEHPSWEKGRWTILYNKVRHIRFLKNN